MVRRPRDAISRSRLSILHETTPPQARFGSSVAERRAVWQRDRLHLTAMRFIRVLTLRSIVLEVVAVELPHRGIVSLATTTPIERFRPGSAVAA